MRFVRVGAAERARLWGGGIGLQMRKVQCTGTPKAWEFSPTQPQPCNITLSEEAFLTFLNLILPICKNQAQAPADSS